MSLAHPYIGAEYEGMFGTFIDLLFPPRESEILLRDLPPDGLVSLLEPQHTELGQLSVTTLLPYEHPHVRAAVLEAKFHGNVRAAGLLAATLATYLNEDLADRNAYETRRTELVPIPLSRKRLAERGYNQVERIACLAAERLPDLRVRTDLLLRVHDTVPQTSLDGTQRRRNVRGAFELSRRPDVDTIYIMVDDVVTTGATLDAAASALRLGGAASVESVSLAH